MRLDSSVVCLCLLCATCTAAETAASTSPKHILFFLIDDYGFADASYKNYMYNGTAAPPTPTIDSLAMSGVRLESYYVNSLCSPTRTALLSGRYAYTIGMENTVIVDGQDVDLPLNLLTMADYLSQSGWNTSAFGKWDAGMTVWGSTPTCRGFDLYRGFYSAASDYFTHMVGTGFDYHRDQCHGDKGSDASVQGVYTTDAVTNAVQEWIVGQLKTKPHAKTFAYVAHEAVHGPLEVPPRYINEECMNVVGDTHPTRLIYCGMVRAVDESVKNITHMYEQLEILQDTLIILSTDNGGHTEVGGSNYPLRGMKATPFEGGVRGLGFVSGAGLAASVRGTVQHGLLHVTDWLPTLVNGVAGIQITKLSRPCPTCNRSIAPLDGVNQWPMLSTGSASARTEVLLKFQTADWDKCTHNGKLPCNIPGSAALRVGKWKLLYGNQVYAGTSRCQLRSGTGNGKAFPIPVLANESSPTCPFGWTPPPRGDGNYEPPRPPTDVQCANSSAGQLPAIPCTLPPDSGYITGQVLLFDVVNDMAEEHNVAADNPEIVTKLLARLQHYNSSYCGGHPCVPDQGKFWTAGVPTKSAGNSSTPLVWLPWRGDPSPAKCDTDRTNARPSPTPSPTPTPPPMPNMSLVSSIHPGWGIFDTDKGKTLHCHGWCWDSAWEGGGTAPMTVRLSVDGQVVMTILANLTQKNLMNATGAPNREHGFAINAASRWVQTLSGKGRHKLDLDVFIDERPSAASPTAALRGSPLCFVNGKPVIMPPGQSGIC